MEDPTTALEKAGCDSFELLHKSQGKVQGGKRPSQFTHNKMLVKNTHNKMLVKPQKFDVAGRSRSLMVSNHWDSWASTSARQRDSDLWRLHSRRTFLRQLGTFVETQLPQGNATEVSKVAIVKVLQGFVGDREAWVETVVGPRGMLRRNTLSPSIAALITPQDVAQGCWSTTEWTSWIYFVLSPSAHICLDEPTWFVTTREKSQRCSSRH